MTHKLFGEILIEEGKLTKQQIEEALNLQKDNPNRKLGEILVTLNYIKYDDIFKTLEKQYKLNGNLPPEVEKWLSQEEIDKLLNSISK